MLIARILPVVIPLLLAPSIFAQQATLLDSTIRVTGLTPEANLVWMRVSHEAQPYMTAVITREAIAPDHDRDGTIEIDFAERIPLRTTFVAVDISSGATVVSSPEGFSSETIIPGDRLGRARGVSHAFDLLELERNELEILVVRPQVGAWRVLSFEGSPGDGDRMNDGVLTVRFADLQPVTAPGAAVPGNLKPGDIVVAIDPESLAHFSHVVGR